MEIDATKEDGYLDMGTHSIVVGKKQQLILTGGEQDKMAEELYGNVGATVDLVTTQEGSVVSRAVLEGEGGGVTLFAFGVGEGLSEHTSTKHALVHMLEGRARYTIGDTEFEARAGEMVVMPANVPHALYAVGEAGFKMLLCLVKP